MKKGLVMLLVLLSSLCILAGCGSSSPQDTVSKGLELDVSEGREVSVYDTHSGNGDGTSCIVLQFEDTTVLEAIEANTDWGAFPLDETVQTLVYGTETENGKMGPFLEDRDGNPLVPNIQNGYYRLIDRHTDKGTELLERHSFNFTVGLYDTDSNTLYYCELDT